MNELDLSAIDKHFPFDEFRPGQRECIEFILNAFNSGKRFVVVEAPTGSGKSAIAMTVAGFAEQSYYITIQKILQSQLVRDFGSDSVVDLKGRSTYPCNYYERMRHKIINGKTMKFEELQKCIEDPPDCNRGYCRKREKKFRSPWCFAGDGGSLTELPHGMFYSACPYYEQVGRTMAAKIALMNFSSFLFQTSMVAGRFIPRDLLIIDEAHQLEPQLLDFISITITDKVLRNFGLRLKQFETAEEYCLYFIDNNLIDKIKMVVDDAVERGDTVIQDEYLHLAKKLETFTQCIQREEEWIAEFKNKDGFNTVTMKPLYVHSHSHPHILDYGKKVLMLSATILDVNVFCSSLGIPRGEVAAYRMSNRFPKENRPIYIHSAGKIVGGRAKMNEWGPKLVKRVDEIIDRYPKQKGIIHTHNFDIANLILQGSRHTGRYLFQKDFKNKDQMLYKHARSENTIIVAPAMHEGLDLHGDLSRLQIVCKVPWPNFVDNKHLACRVEADQRYLLWLTALKLIQSVGRSIRSETDWADTYIIDEVFERFIRDARSMIPGWFMEAVDYGRNYKLNTVIIK